MKRILFCLALLTGGAALAQQAFIPGEWDCSGGGGPLGPNGGVYCVPSCQPVSGYGESIPDFLWECRLPPQFPDRLKTMASTCSNFAERLHGLPRCYPNGTDYHAQLNLLSETPVVSGGDDSSGKEKALFAAGGALLGAVLVNAFSEHLPESVSLTPSRHVSLVDGEFSTSAGLAFGWREWTVSSSANHSRWGWSKPYTRVDWTWEF